MALIVIESGNENLSYILEKNPATQEAQQAPFKKALKTSNTFLWYETPTKVVLHLKGFDNNKSSKDFSYLDYSSFSLGSSYLTLIEAQARRPLLQQHELDTIGCTATFTIYDYLERDFSKLFENVISCSTENRHSTLIIEGKTLKEVLEHIAVISMLVMLHNEDYFVEIPQFMKYLEMATRLTKNYKILRSYVSFIKSPNVFKDSKPFLDTSGFDFQLRRVYECRKEFFTTCVSNRTKKNISLLDLGCGDGAYFKLAFKNNYEQITGVDIDSDCAVSAGHSARKAQIEDSVKVINKSIEEFLVESGSLENTDVLLTEVLEHIPQEQSKGILSWVLSLSPDNVFITVPNSEFNIHYGMEPNTFRHDDHFWEPTYKEFQDFIKTTKGIEKYTLEYSPIGDRLLSDPLVSSSIGLCLKKIETGTE